MIILCSYIADGNVRSLRKSYGSKQAKIEALPEKKNNSN